MGVPAAGSSNPSSLFGVGDEASSQATDGHAPTHSDAPPLAADWCASGSFARLASCDSRFVPPDAKLQSTFGPGYAPRQDASGQSVVATDSTESIRLAQAAPGTTASDMPAASKENRAAVTAALQHAREVQSRMSPGPDKDRVGKILDFYATPGVTIVFSPKVVHGNTQLDSKDGHVTVTLGDPFDRMGTGWPGAVIADVQASTLMHEGSHGLDARATGHNPRNHDEAMATERAAYRVQSKLHQAFGTKDLAGTWDPAWLAKPATLEATRTAAIEKAAANSASGWK